MDQSEELKEFLRERNEALLSRDSEKVIAFHAKWNPDRPPMHPMVAELAMHKARTGAKTLPIEERRVSHQWLKIRGYTSLDDGEFE